jgi:hypothetical protein
VFHPVEKLRGALERGDPAVPQTNPVVAESLQSTLDNLGATASGLDTARLASMAASILEAQTVFTLGFGLSAHLAAMLSLHLQPAWAGDFDAVQSAILHATHLKHDGLAFQQAAEALLFQISLVHVHVRPAVVARDKAKAFCGVPLRALACEFEFRRRNITLKFCHPLWHWTVLGGLYGRQRHWLELRAKVLVLALAFEPAQIVRILCGKLLVVDDAVLHRLHGFIHSHVELSRSSAFTNYYKSVVMRRHAK